MGADIHPVAQLRQSDGTWAVIEGECAECKGSGKLFYESDKQWHTCFWCEGKGKDNRGYHRRDYGLFALLADVRNYNEIPPLAQPRGWPDDLVLDTGVDEDGHAVGPDYPHLGGVWLGDHSYTWYTLPELLAYPWGERFEVWGRYLEKLKDHGDPENIRIVMGFDN